jgi:hypothetical protein
VPADKRFHCCNHGYSRGVCERFPAEERRSAIRFHLVAHCPESIDVLCIEECGYAPLQSFALRSDIGSGRVDGASDLCLQAQAAAFCRSYAERLSAALELNQP